MVAAKTNAISGQFQFPVKLLADLKPCEIRSEFVERTRVLVVVPDSPVRSEVATN